MDNVNDTNSLLVGIENINQSIEEAPSGYSISIRNQKKEIKKTKKDGRTVIKP